MLAKVYVNQRSSYLSIWAYKKYATAVNVKLDSSSGETSSYVTELQQEWLQAQPFTSLPGPTKFQMFRGFLKGGDFYGRTFEEFMKICRERYGNIYLLPGMFGQNTNLITYNLDDYQKIFRTEGTYPERPGFDVVTHYRLNRKDELYEDGNLGVAAKGPEWGKFRHTVNPVLMQPKNTVLYIEPTQKVNDDFIQRIRQIRNPDTLEVPENFLSEIHRLSFESVASIALDKEMGLVRNVDPVPEAQLLFDQLQIFNKSFYDLGVKPSLYKYFRTPTYRRFEKTMDSMTEICHKFVKEALQRVEEKGDMGEAKSVLEKLVKIDRKIAVVMAIDMLIAGIDATSTVMSAALLCLAVNPEKQEKMRQEVLTNVGKTERFSIENMKSLPYLRACIKEAMRVYPVTIGNLRTTGMNLCLSGYQVPKGSHIFLASNLLLNEERYFPKPKEYMPERWLRMVGTEMESFSAKNISPFIFLPFGFGPRSCVGKRVVDLELEITLANLVRNFKWEYNYPTENAFRNIFTNTCVIPLKFKFTDLN